MAGDHDVEFISNSLSGKRILFGITGGIAATDSVRISRELRRHYAELSVMMTPAAQKVITPLAVEWASHTKVQSEWDSDMAQLDHFDAVFVCPASRNFIARFVNGMMDHPLLMACSAARSRNVPIILIPSMHNDLFDDPVTSDLCIQAESIGATCIWGPNLEGRMKQPNAKQVVADLCHHVNKGTNSRKIAITLGANRAPIDAVRAIQNASSGATGWSIAEYLHRKGHDVICIAGKTSSPSPIELPRIIRAGQPDEMLSACMQVVEESPDAWIHAAAVLDYYSTPEKGKKASSSDDWVVTLSPGPKHIRELTELTNGAIRIGFKLETGVSLDVLHDKALKQISDYGVDATIANMMEEIHNPDTPRAHIVTKDGEMTALADINSMCEAIESLIIS
jgi:phosphopantothenoylcysteine decarboxylase/phosphopantothenate--cysteine ligase